MGQIHSKTELGRWLTFISSLSDVRTIVDIGTWSGAGSTLRIAKGVKKRPPKYRPGTIVVGFEIDKKMVGRARRRLRGFKFVNIVHGSIVHPEALDKDSLNLDEQGWLEADLDKMSCAPLVLEYVPEHIDLLVLDGGEFSSQAEFLTLQDRVQGWVVLDDINTRKNRTVFGLLTEDKSFSLVWKTKERNGAAIFRKMPSECSVG